MPQHTIHIGYIKDNHVDGQKMLSPEEVEKFDISIGIVNRFLFNDNLIQIFRINLNEFLEFDDEIKRLVSEKEIPTNSEWQRTYLNYNRLCINMLSTFRTLIDHFERYFKKQFGKKSPEALSFKKALSEAFNNHFAYRFSYKLRNYTQHCELPVDTKLSTDKNADLIRLLYFDRDKLLRLYDGWGVDVKQDLKSHSAQIDVVKTTLELSKVVGEIFKKAEDIVRPSLQESCRILMQFIKPFWKAEIKPTVFNDLHFDENGKGGFGVYRIPFAAIAKFAEMSWEEEE